MLLFIYFDCSLLKCNRLLPRKVLKSRLQISTRRNLKSWMEFQVTH